MKKLVTIILISLCLTGCSTKPESSIYTTAGWYYTCGEVITEDGNIWGYTADEECHDEEPVLVVFDDAGTPDNIYDDEIIGLIK